MLAWKTTNLTIDTLSGNSVTVQYAHEPTDDTYWWYLMGVVLWETTRYTISIGYIDPTSNVFSMRNNSSDAVTDITVSLRWLGIKK